MDLSRIEGYIERVYGYSVRRTHSREEADELSQEILLTVIRELPKLRDESRFEPWLWGVASNVANSFRRSMGRQRAMYSYGAPEDAVYEEQLEDEQEEEYAELREKIAMLSAAYREIIILYYYDGLSVKQISEKLKIPEGTITWRLSEARRRLKKEWVEVKESALRPVKMVIDIYGSGYYDGKRIPFPSEYIRDALSQNILYCCYEEAKGIEELAKECGVPAYYVEERMENLLKRDAVIEVSKGKYRTDFIIWMDKHGAYCEENAERVLSSVMDRMVAAIKGIADEAAGLDFYRGTKSEKDLLYLYGVLAFDYASRKYGRMPWPKMEKRYDGAHWRYIGSIQSGKYQLLGLGHQIGWNDAESCRHVTYGKISGIKFREIMYNDSINACEDILNTGEAEDAEAAARAIEAGYIARRSTDNRLQVMIPAFTKEQKEAFDVIADRHLAPLMAEYNEAIRAFTDGYRKLFPAHLSDDIDRMCQNTFMNMYAVVIRYAQRTGAIEMPSEGCYCDVLIQTK